MVHSPSEHGVGQRFTFWVQISKFHQGDNALGDTMNIDRIGSIVKVTNCTVRAEKVRVIELKATLDAGIELHCLEITANGPQRT
jgi:hypothetical protein